MNRSDTWAEEFGLPKNSFEAMVDNDIQKCDEYLSGDYDEKEGISLHLELIAKYPPYVPDFGDSLYNFS